MQQFYRLISTDKPLNIPLYNNYHPQSQSLSQNNESITQNNHSNCQQVNIKSKQSQSSTLNKDSVLINSINSINSQYVSQVILISQSVICTVTKHNLDFYSIKLLNQSTQQKQQTNHTIQSTNHENHINDRFIGRIAVNNQIRKQLNLYLKDMQSQQQNLKNKQSKVQRLSFIQEKGIIYHQKTNTFYLLVQSLTNKYFISFVLNINEFNTQSSQQQLIKQGKSNINNYNSIQISNFSVIYDFNQSSSQVKYSLQLNPQILFLSQSSTPILIRKFYNDSFVVIFQPQQIIRNINRIQQLKYMESSSTQRQQQQLNNNKNNLITNKNTKFINYWSFYINEECLSCMDQQNFLVNYRQLITKNHVQIDIIDINNKQKTFIRISQGIQPMTIKSIQLYLPYLNTKTNKNKQSQQKHIKQSWRIRIFSILKRSQTSYILDYDIIHQTVINSYRLDNVFIDNVSFSNKQRQYYFVNYLYNNKNWLGILKCDLNDGYEYDDGQYLMNNNNGEQDIPSFKLVNSLIDSSVEFQLNSMVWNVNIGLIIQSTIQVRNNMLKVKLSKVINKSVHYVKLIDQLKQPCQILKNQSLSTTVYQMLQNNHSN